MPIADWFSARDSRRYTQAGGEQPPVASDVPDGVWAKCEGCKRTLYEGELVESMRVCRHCGHHFALTAEQRIELLTDAGSFSETETGLLPADPLEFVAAKPYSRSIEAAREKSGLDEAVVTGDATIGGTPIILAVMDFRYIGASMGSVVGEKITRAFESATAKRRPIVIVTASGGARMQEGMYSLMQMAKTSAAAKRHTDAGLAYVSVLTNPTYGGVTASFAVLADVLIAEPGAMIGFAGPRLVEDTIRQKLPKGFQTAEFMLKHGMVDAVVERAALAERVSLLIGYLTAREGQVG
ncbi:MAG: acetyl-CoA carboxylase, carboxyltransferase subunit beta [Coriobacteriia bacterium]|nr:acetyl-CoA carboxylase, carboxyltransferase subunit beta [Coriobacteriia bacterium]